MSHKNQNLDVRLIIVGIEGELIDTEILHYKKWLSVALEAKIVADEAAFKKLWQNDLIGIGDKAVYNRLVAEGEEYGRYLPMWEKVQAQINKYYLDHIKEAKIPEGMAEAVALSRQKGVRVMIVTHAPRELTKVQLDYVKSKTGIGFDINNDIIFGERKDGDAYQVALDYVNLERKKEGLPFIQAQNVLVLDASEKYLERAKKSGMRAASIALNLPAFLRSAHPAQKFMSMDWMDIPRFIVKGPSPQAGSPGASPR